MNDNQLATLTAWLQSPRVDQVVAFAASIGIDIDAMDCIKLFHYVNDQRSNDNERNEIAL
jgi:hypothetical protein